MEDRIKKLQVEWRRSRIGRRFAIIELAVSMIIVIALVADYFLFYFFAVTHSDPDHSIAMRVRGGLGRVYVSSHIHLLLGSVMLVAAIFFIIVMIILVIDNYYFHKIIYRKYRSDDPPDNES